jgi:hypothetical protein
MEEWAIWRRFERAYRAGEVEWSGDTSSWAALPEDRARLEALRPTVERALQIGPARRVVLRGEFRALEQGPADMPPGVMRPLDVRWTPVQ